MDGTVIIIVDRDVRRMHDCIKRAIREAKHDREELDVIIRKNCKYFARAWARSYSAGAIGFSGDLDVRSYERW